MLTRTIFLVPMLIALIGGAVVYRRKAERAKLLRAGDELVQGIEEWLRESVPFIYNRPTRLSADVVTLPRQPWSLKWVECELVLTIPIEKRDYPHVAHLTQEFCDEYQRRHTDETFSIQINLVRTDNQIESKGV
jgi:hypothetical protein